MSEPLPVEALEQIVQTEWLGRSAHFFPEIDSTNDWLKKQAVLDPGLAHGTVVFTDFQTRGRGRLERRWEAPPGTSLLFSAYFRLHWPPERANWLTMAAGLAAVDAVAALSGVDAWLKWPNDVVVPAADGGWRKLGGILLESTWKSGRLVGAVLGVGLNVNVPAADFPPYDPPATSLLAETGHAVPLLPLLAGMLERLEPLVDAASNGASPQPAWAARLILQGRDIQVSGAGEAPLSGEFAGTDDGGNLLLRDAAGVVHTIAAGDVSLRG